MIRKLVFAAFLCCLQCCAMAQVLPKRTSDNETAYKRDSSLRAERDHIRPSYPQVERRSFDSITKETEGVMKCTDKTGLSTFISGYRVEITVKYLYVIRFYDSVTHKQVGIQGPHKVADNMPKFHTEYYYFNRKHEKLSAKWKVIGFSKSD